MEENTCVDTTKSEVLTKNEAQPHVVHQDVPVGGGEATGSVTDSVSDEGVVKRRRGRPSKHDDFDNRLSLVSSRRDVDPAIKCEKRARGRPRGSGKLQLLASLGGVAAETAGGNFVPHVATIYKGEDIVSKILSFSQKGRHAVCVLSATGVVSSVTLHQPNSCSGVLRYEGRFEILSLSGSFTSSEEDGVPQRRGMLSVSLAKPDGRVFGGGIVGSLVAAGPIQLVVANFKQNISREIRMRQLTESATSVGAFGHSNGKENWTTPVTALAEPKDGQEDYRVATNQSSSLVSQNIDN